jgi:hypothetical protein
MTAIALTPEAEAFLARVRDELADLPPDERDELLEDIESHLAEVAGEGGAGLAARLGSAEEFAQELRISAGLPPRAPVSSSRLRAVRARLESLARRGEWLRVRLDAALAWRLARGWLLAVALAVAVATVGGGEAWERARTWLPRPGIGAGGAVVVMVALVAASVWLGLRAGAGRGLRLDRVASALALVAIAPAAWHIDNPSPPPAATTVGYQNVQGLRFNGVPVGNIFPFDANGKPLDDVLLYRSNGEALNVDAYRIDPKRRYLVAPNGRRLYNSFPVRVYNRGTHEVAKGWIRPSVHIAKLQIPSLGNPSP